MVEPEEAFQKSGVQTWKWETEALVCAAPSIKIFISWSFIRATQTIEQCRLFFIKRTH